MCGIFGGLALRRRFEVEPARALRELAHRGPDGQGCIAVDESVLAFRRLRIIDLSPAGEQPMWDVTKELVIVFNGEIYNYRELRSECIAAGVAFGSSSDTEVILGQYRLHGWRAFDRLNGMFAFCLYDTRSGEAFLVRDPFGIKPLYYASTAEGVFFSSELKPLMGIAGISGEIDRTALQAYLQLDFVPTPYAILRGVRKLDSGYFLRVDRSGGVESRKYLERRPAQLGESALEEFGREIDAAVERHLISDVPIGIFLSGGIDSAIVAESARRIAGPISTFSIAFEDPSFDESRYFNEVSTGLGTRQHTRTLAGAAMLDLLPEVARGMSEPLADGSIYPTYLLSRFAREHVTVALSGDGADELFAGYPTYFAHSLVERLPRSLIAILRSSAGAAHRLLPVRYENLSADFKLKKFLDGLDDDLVRRHIRWMGTFTSEQLPSLLLNFDRDAQFELDRLFLAPSLETKDGWLERVLRTDQRFYLQDGVLVKVDRASMASSLEVRVPFLDRRIVALADGLRASRKMRGRETKVLLRAHAAKHFPPLISRRPKKGFGVPLGRWFREELRTLVAETLSPKQVEKQGFFNPKFVQRLLTEHWEGKRDNRKQIFNLLTFAFWVENFGGDRR